MFYDYSNCCADGRGMPPAAIYLRNTHPAHSAQMEMEAGECKFMPEESL